MKLPTTCTKLCTGCRRFSLFLSHPPKPRSREGNSPQYLPTLVLGRAESSPQPPALRASASAPTLCREEICLHAQRKHGDSQRHLAHASCARPNAGALSGEQLLSERRRQNRGALTEKKKNPGVSNAKQGFPASHRGGRVTSLQK